MNWIHEKSRGVTLIELLVGAAVGLVVFYALGNLFVGFLKQQAATSRVTERERFRVEMRALRDCQATIANSGSACTGSYNIYDKKGNIQISTSQMKKGQHYYKVECLSGGKFQVLWRHESGSEWHDLSRVPQSC